MATAKKLPSGAYRCLIYDYTDASGKRHYKSFTAPTKKEAELKAAQYSVTKETSKTIPEYTLNEAVEAYCSLKSNVLSPATLREYRRMPRYYAALGETMLKKIDSDCVQKWVNDFSMTHSPKTVRNAYGLISAIMEAYSPDTRLKVTMPQKVRPTLYVPSDGDVQTLLRYFIDRGDKDMELAVYLAAFGTLRRSEICALTADDVKGNIVAVNKAMVDKGSNEWVVKTTKTVASNRFVEIPAFVVEKFPTSGKIITITPDMITHRMIEAMKHLEINKFRFHDLRHYAASIMHAIGVPDVYIMQRGGWSSDTTLKNIYRGSIEDYMQKYNDMTLNHFENFEIMQHEMQHKNKKP